MIMKSAYPCHLAIVNFQSLGVDIKQVLQEDCTGSTTLFYYALAPDRLELSIKEGAIVV